MSMTSSHAETATLSEHVQSTIKTYLENLEGDLPVDLYKMVIEEIELPLLATVMQHTNNNQSLAAKILGLSRQTLRSKLKKYFLCGVN